jgi:hypothetical protein
MLPARSMQVENGGIRQGAKWRRDARRLWREPGTFEAWGKDPHKTLSVIEFPRIGTLKKGFDG